MSVITIFEYKGIVCINSEETSEGMLSPIGPGKFGCVTDGDKIKITKSAMKLLSKIPRGRDAIGDIDCFKAHDGMNVFCWWGPCKRTMDISEGLVAARGTNLSFLTPVEDSEVEVLEEFKEAIDNPEEETE